MPAFAFSASRPKRNRRLDAVERRQLLWPVTFFLTVIILDQITKVWAVATLSGRPPFQFLGSFVQFSLVYNEGGAMGTSFGSPLMYTIVALAILPILGWYVWMRREEKALAWPLAFMAGGAVGNLIDRIRLGQVVDFIDINIPDIHLPFYQLDRFWTFNIADAAITCSLVFLVIQLLFFQKAERSAGEETPRVTVP
jgi:signal peptidase II